MVDNLDIGFSRVAFTNRFKTDAAAFAFIVDKEAPVFAAAFADDFALDAADGDILFRTGSFERHAKMAEYEEGRADEHRLARAEIAVGDDAADERHQVNERRIGRVDALAFIVGKKEMLRQVKHQQRAHAVEGKPLPHLGEEEDREPLRMAEE